MAKFRLDFEANCADTKLQMELDPPGEFKNVDEAVDWALTNLPRGVAIAIFDGRGKLRASGLVGLKIQEYK